MIRRESVYDDGGKQTANRNWISERSTKRKASMTTMINRLKLNENNRFVSRKNILFSIDNQTFPVIK